MSKHYLTLLARPRVDWNMHKLLSRVMCEIKVHSVNKWLITILQLTPKMFYLMDDQFQIRFAVWEREWRSALAINHHSKSDQGMPTLTRLKYFTLLLLRLEREKEPFFGCCILAIRILFSRRQKIHQFPGQRFECNIMGHLRRLNGSRKENKNVKNWKNEFGKRGQKDKP